jgi:DNA-binding NarL/FixJ family response regulator
MPTHEIAEYPFLTESTIKNHLHPLYARIGVTTRTQAVVLLLTGDIDQHWLRAGTGG